MEIADELSDLNENEVEKRNKLEKINTEICTYDMYTKELHILFEEFDTSGSNGDKSSGGSGDGVLDYKEIRLGLSKLFHESGKRWTYILLLLPTL
jgi:hypothetical protein